MTVDFDLDFAFGISSIVPSLMIVGLVTSAVLICIDGMTWQCYVPLLLGFSI